MSILSRLMKAKDAGGLHVAHAGRATFNVSPFFEPGKVSGDQLVKRYGFWVHRCVKLNAEAAASVPFKLMRVARGQAGRDGLKSGRYRPLSNRAKAYLRGRMNVQPSASVQKAMQGNIDDLVEVESAPILDTLHEVNDWQDGYAHRVGIYSDIQIFGRAFDLIVDGQEPVELWRIMPQRTKVLRDPVNFVAGFQVGDGGDKVIYDADEVLWFREFDPDDPWGGVGPLEAWLKTIDAGFAIETFQHWLMSRGGMPGKVLVTESPMDEKQKRSFWRRWSSLFGRMGSQSEAFAILTAKEAHFEDLGQTNRELEFTASSDQKRDQIGQAFGVPKSILDVSTIRANNREAKQQHIEYTVWPMIQRVEDVLNARFVPRFGEGMFLMHENPVPDDREIRIQDRESKLRSGWSINEVRADEGEEPSEDPDAEVAFVGSGLVPLETAAAPLVQETDTEDDEPDIAAAGDGATPDAVLQGQQITAASAIIQAVIDEKIPFESARGQLIVMFNLDDAQADQMLAGVEGFEKPEPEMPMLPPGAEAPSGPGGDSDEPLPANAPGPGGSSLPDDAKAMLAASNTHTMAVLEGFSAVQKAMHDLASIVAHRDNGQVHLHQGSQQINLPAHEQPVIVNNEVKVPELPAPEPATVNVNNEVKMPELPAQEPPIVTVQNQIDVPEQKQEAPIVTVQNEVNPTPVHVEPADVKVEVAAPPPAEVKVEVEVEAPSVEVAAPVVNVQQEPAKILVEPQIEVNLNGAD